ncbi:MAG TPA: creatininase family protein [Nitrososphaeraceae archaeon]|nr:creatininase family protein [Nitrososphaeraceae archaeon]
MKDNETFLIENMNGRQIREKVNDETIALLILGACENHGDHLPFGSDFIFPLELAKRVAIKIKNMVIFPPIPYGVSSHHKKFFMTISLGTNTLISIIENILESIYNNGIHKILIINGHDGNIAPIEIASRNIKDKYSNITIACLESWWELIGKLSPNTFDIWYGLGHGGEAETSALMRIRPELVDKNNIPEDTIPKLPKHLKIYWTMDELTKTGATGSATSASVNKGEIICKILEDILISFLRDMEKTQWKYGLYI